MATTASSEAAVRLRQTEAVTQEVLNQLDKQASSPGGSSKRRAVRYPYRIAALKVEIAAPNGRVRCFLAPSRNISRTGIGLLFGQFVFPKLRCAIELLSRHGQRQRVSGVVAHCRYLSGANLHEVGIQFDQPIDIAQFRRDTRRCYLLALEGAPEQAGLLEPLRALETRTILKPAAGALAELEKAAFDAVLIDLNADGAEPVATLTALRQTGFGGALLGLCGQEDEATRETFVNAGCSALCVRPCEPADLLARLEAAGGAPLRSSLRQDPTQFDSIDTFVAQLPRRLWEVEAAARRSEWSAVRECAAQLRLDAAAAGFETVGETAAAIESAAADSAVDAATLAPHLARLATTMLRVRPETLGRLPGG